MKLKVVVGVLLVIGLFSPMLFAAQFRCGFLKRKVETTLSIPRPPDVLILTRNIQVVVAEKPKSLNRQDENRMRREVEQALTPDFIIDNNKPETIFKIYVVDYEPVIREYRQTERRRVVVGQECKKDKNGKESCTDKYEYRDVPVRYWEANVQMNWRVEAVGSSGMLLDSAFRPGDVYKSKKEMSINGVPQPDAKSLPSEREIRNQLIANMALKFTSRYRKTYDYLTVDLACSDELTPGNKLVEDSANVARKNWEGALKLWGAAKMKRTEYEGDRLYNMAVAYEALAFGAFDVSGVPEDADHQFDKAMELYQQAMTMDPEEKYIQRAAERLQISKNNLRRAKEHRDIKEHEEQFVLESTQVEEEARRQAAALIEREDTTEEKNFRTYVRARFGNLAAVDDEELDKVVFFGRERFKLDENQTFRVVYQENMRKDKIRQYKEDFEIFVVKGLITKDDRDALNAIAESLSLTADDVKTVESSYTFKDESITDAISR